jgi:hypothetical protein
MSAAIEAVESELIQDGSADTLASLGVTEELLETVVVDVVGDVETVVEFSAALTT